MSFTGLTGNVERNFLAYYPAESRNLSKVTGPAHPCGHCGNLVAPEHGYYAQNVRLYIFMCPSCQHPTYSQNHTDIQTVGTNGGTEVGFLAQDVDALYREAHQCLNISSYTGTVLLCRKLLMTLCVAQGAEPNKSFKGYMEYLIDNGYVPQKGQGWVDHISQKLDEATHDLTLMTRADAEDLLTFVEMLFKSIYDYPSRIRAAEPLEIGQSEMRQAMRFPVQFAISFSGGRIVWEGTANNLSRGGCRIESSAQVLNESTMTLRAHIPDQRAPLQVEVAAVRWSIGREFGVKFISMGTPEWERLHRFVSALELKHGH